MKIFVPIFAVAATLTCATATAAPRETRTAPASINVFGLADDAMNTPFTLNYTGNAGGVYTAKALRFQGTIDAVFFGTWCTELIVTVTPPGGAPFAAQMYALNGNFSTRAFNSFVPLPAGTAAAGNWSFKFHDNALDNAPTFADAQLNGLTIALDDGVYAAPAAVNVGTLAAGTVTQSVTLAPSEVKWYRFTLATTIDPFNSNSLDIHTNGSGINDTMIAVYDNLGTIKAADDDQGDGFLSFLSFGVGTNAGGASLGQDGALPIGTYYLGVGEFRCYNGPVYWDFRTVEPDLGEPRDVSVTFTVAETTGAATPPTVNHDFGTVGTGVASHAFADVPAGQITWVKFTTPFEAIDATGYYVDIDTVNSITDVSAFGVPDDTEIGLYRSNGLRIANNDDSGPAFLSALSFGDAVPARAYTAVAAGNGRNGRLPAGIYYAAAGTYNLTFNPSDFDVFYTNGGVNATSLVINVRSNFPPALCSVADVGTTGGVAGQDRRLDNNDFVAFINLFFANAPAADVGRVGGQDGADNAWDNNDFVVFINHFFNDAANCTG